MFHDEMFPREYDVVVNPELPGAGVWPSSTYVFTRESPRPEPGLPVRSPYLTVQVEPEAYPTWVGHFQSGLWGVSGVCPTPSPRRVCVLSSGAAWLVQVAGPVADWWSSDDVVQVVPVPGAGMLLLVSWTDIAAVGPEGVCWTTGRLALDDVCVVSADPDEIVCRAMVVGGEDLDELVLSTADGTLRRGPVYREW